MRNEYNFLNSFWMKMDTDSVGYCRIRMWNRIEKINENRIRMYPFYYHIKFEYGYGYPYWCLNGYGFRIIRISAICFPPLLPASHSVISNRSIIQGTHELSYVSSDQFRIVYLWPCLVHIWISSAHESRKNLPCMEC